MTTTSEWREKNQSLHSAKILLFQRKANRRALRKTLHVNNRFVRLQDMFLTIASPSPVPPTERERVLSTPCKTAQNSSVMLLRNTNPRVADAHAHLLCTLAVTSTLPT